MENINQIMQKQCSNEPITQDNLTSTSIDIGCSHSLIRDQCSKYCLRKYITLPNNAGILQKIRYAFLCPPFGCASSLVTRSALLILFWLLLLSLTKSGALPSGIYFSILAIFVSCSVCGYLIKLCHLPSLLGMLFAGFTLKNIPIVNNAVCIDEELSSTLRSAALAVIMIRAGLGLDAAMLKKLSFAVVRLAFTPCLVESGAVGVASIFILGLPWMWAIMLGFVLGSVSPAVVVPAMLSLTKRGLGVNKGIPTLAIAASSIDDVLAITGFGVFLAMAMSTGGIALTIVKAPLEALAGIMYGILTGLFLWYLPSMDDAKQSLLRFVSLLCIGLVAIYGSVALHLSGAGALGCLTVAFVAAYRWRLSMTKEYALVLSSVDVSWIMLKPLLFGLIGAEVDFQQLQLVTIGYGLAVLAIGLVFRSIAAYLIVFGLKLTFREKLFIAIVWLPKATVQAAIGPVALDTARSLKLGDNSEQLGLQVLTIAVLSIILTAPLGAAAIAIAGPRCLVPQPLVTDQNQVNETIYKTNDTNQSVSVVQVTKDIADVEV